ncbi:hypothetical protein BACCAP_00394 [Pseudoflavonifractor capillosus ATCC 29799]|uniref:Uncharacterized protein n=1 Tax=Pseudoflavonifractor capillosus ATCC 29799 TaxID=411467 RepID=A6NQC4_9FIRM|nr:hypothetical protein BACCAP_00394 [Pseudoflavonifractor capillosus ATCC 29799]
MFTNYPLPFTKCSQFFQTDFSLIGYHMGVNRDDTSLS